jgi:hypothetical protein
LVGFLSQPEYNNELGSRFIARYTDIISRGLGNGKI